MKDYQSTALPSSKKIADLYGKIEDGSLDVRPAFQRKLVWNDKHKVKFIDTILRGYPFPEIYLANDEVDTDNIVAKELVVDGQQRLTTVVEYIKGKLAIPKGSDILPFAKLDQVTKRRFLNYPVTVRHFLDVDNVVLREIFKRINQTQYSLNAFEVNQAVYDGEFIATAKRLCESDSFKKLPTFRERDLSRMLDLGFVLLIMTTIENEGYFSNDKEVERYIKLFDDKYSNKSEVFKNISSILEDIYKRRLKDDSMWFRKSNLFTLIIESFWATEVPSKESLTAFEDFVISAKDDTKDNDFSKYYSFMFTGTNSRQARVGRGAIFRQYN